MAIYQIDCLIARVFAMGLTVVTSPLTNRTVVIYDLRKYNAKLDISSLIASFCFPTLVCFVIVIVGAIFLIKNFNKSRQQRDAMAGKTREEKSYNVAAIVRSVIFYIVCNTPNVLTNVLSTKFPYCYLFHSYLGNIIRVIYGFLWMLQAASCFSNIFVYIQMSSRFKQIFLRLIKSKP